MADYSARQRPPPLLSRSALLGIALSALFLLGGLVPLVMRKQAQAVFTAPASLSILYLRLSVFVHPNDCGLRLELAREELRAQQLTAAHANVTQVLACSGWVAPARELLLEVDK